MILQNATSFSQLCQFILQYFSKEIDENKKVDISKRSCIKRREMNKLQKTPAQLFVRLNTIYIFLNLVMRLSIYEYVKLLLEI